MAWKTVVEKGGHHPQKGEQGFKSKPSNEKVSKILTVRLTEEQFNVMKNALKDSPFNSLSDLTRAAILHFLMSIDADTTMTPPVSKNQLELMLAFATDAHDEDEDSED